MKTILKITSASILLLISLVNSGYGQLPVIDVAETYTSNMQPRLIGNDPTLQIDEVFSDDVTEVQLSFIKYQDSMAFLTLYISYINDYESVSAQLLYAIEQVKRGHLKTSHFLALGKGKFNGKFMIVTITTDSQDIINKIELTNVGDKTKLAVPGLKLTGTESF